METISNIATAASKAIWGEDKASHVEPVSGKLGNVAAGEPYDAGNMEPPEAALTPAEKREAEQDEETAAPVGTGLEPQATNLPPAKPQEDAKPAPGHEYKETEPAQPAQPAINPAQIHPSAEAMRDDSDKAQNDTRAPPPPPPPPSHSPHPSRDHTTTTTTTTTTTSATQTDPTTTTPTTTAAAADNDDEIANAPVKIEGPGPRPLEQVAREHGGDAGAVGRHSRSHSGAGEPRGEGQQQQWRRRDSGKSLGREQEEEGQGEQEEEEITMMRERARRSSGLAADGGDFDAARAGAGKEADRLLEEKGGAHRGHGGRKHVATAATAEAGGTKEKMGLKSKIKAKLHKSSLAA